MPIFFAVLFSFAGSNFYLYSSLSQTLNEDFTISLWVVALSNYPASLISLGRSAAYPNSGQFTIEIDAIGHIHFWDYSTATGRGFSVLSGNLIVKGTSLLIHSLFLICCMARLRIANACCCKQKWFGMLHICYRAAIWTLSSSCICCL